MRRPELMAALLEHFGDDFFLLYVRFVDVLNRHAVLRGKCLRAFARPIAPRCRKLRIVKDSDALGVQKNSSSLVRNTPQAACQ
jgi:hypothetical protein